MNLTIVTETFPPEINGVAMTFGHIVRELTRRGHAVTVLHPRRNDRVNGKPYPGFNAIGMPGLPIPGYPSMRFGLPAYQRLRRMWQNDRPDLVHVVTEGPLGASAVTVARRLQIPVTSSFHTNFHTYLRHYGVAGLQRTAIAWLRRVHNRTRRTFAPTVELRDELLRLGFANVGLLSRGVDTAQFSPVHRSAALRASWGAAPEDPVVLHVGRIAAEKNYPLLFRAFDAIRAANPKCRFVLQGDGPLRAALQSAHGYALFTGFVPHEELAAVYASSDVYLHASLTETFGNVLTEAMASGLAVAGFDYAAARQFIRNGENGISMRRDDPDAFVRAGVELATRPALRDRLRAAARSSLLEQSWENVVGQFEADLLRVLGNARPAVPVS